MPYKYKLILNKIFGKKTVNFSKFLILHPKLFIRSVLYYAFYFFLNRSHLLRNILNKTNAVDNDTLVTLTTYDKRLSTVHLTIESILNQEIKPAKVVLWLYRGDVKNSNIIHLEKLKERGLTIVYLDDNQKSYKKLSYILKYIKAENLNIKNIVTADDDVLYPRFWLSGLIEKSKTLPKSIVCYRGHNLEKINDSTFSYFSCIDRNSSYDQPSDNLLPTGVSGVLYPIKSLDSRICNFKLINQLCRDGDDIWYKFVTLSNGYSSVRIKNKNITFPVIISSLVEGLQDENVTNDENTSKILLTNSYFNNLLNLK